jgi:hypothetical protein
MRRIDRHAMVGRSAGRPIRDWFRRLVSNRSVLRQQHPAGHLAYEWPCGFASFEIAIWNPGRDWFSNDEMNALQDALGYPVRQVMAHI